MYIKVIEAFHGVLFTFLHKGSCDSTNKGKLERSSAILHKCHGVGNCPKFIALLSIIISWSCNRTQKKTADMLSEFSYLKPPSFPKSKGLTSSYYLEKATCVSTCPDVDKLGGSTSFFPFFFFSLLWKLCEGEWELVHIFPET